MALGSACLIAGFFFKQTVIVFAVVPLVTLVLGGRRPARAEVLLALVPLAACGAAIIGLKALNPVVYHYMIKVPGAYAIDRATAAKRIWQLLIESPLFLVLIGDWIVRDGASLRRDARMVWVLAVLTVAIPSSVIAYAKFGGAPNSLLPALLAMMAFCALRLPEVLERSDDRAPRVAARYMLGAFLGLLLLMTTFPHSGVIVGPPPWDEAYRRVVAVVAGLNWHRRLPGGPHDPAPCQAIRGAQPGLRARRPSGGRGLVPPIAREHSGRSARGRICRGRARLLGRLSHRRGPQGAGLHARRECFVEPRILRDLAASRGPLRKVRAPLSRESTRGVTRSDS